METNITLTKQNRKILIVIGHNRSIKSVDNKSGVIFPFVVNQPYNASVKLWAENNGFKWNGEDISNNKIFGIKTKDIPKGHELRILFPSKFKT